MSGICTSVQQIDDRHACSASALCLVEQSLPLQVGLVLKLMSLF